VFRERLRRRLTDTALQQFERKEVDLATETLHRSISGRRLFEAGERLIDDLGRLWRQTVRSDAWTSEARRNRYLLIGVAAGLCVAVVTRFRRRA
jgi:hypothetical protein